MANGGGISVATEEVSPAEVMILPRGATMLTVWSSGKVKEAYKATASAWVVLTLMAQSWPRSFVDVGSSRRPAVMDVVVPLICNIRCKRGPATRKKAPT